MSSFFADKIKDFRCNFDQLEAFVTNRDEVGVYYAWLRDKYRAYFSAANGDQKNKFIIRYYRAKKLMYSSAQMFAEAQYVKSESCIVAYYYLSYYALFQAMQANLMVSVDFNDDTVLLLSHDNVKTHFDHDFCQNRRCPINGEIITQLERLRKYREYYSYAMPFNLAEDMVIDDSTIEKYIKLCYQLLNFRLFVIYQDVLKSIKLDISGLNCLKDYMKESCSRMDDSHIFHDDADKNFWSELVSFQGADIIPITISYEHDFDEYGTYDTAIYEKMGIPKTDKIVSTALRLIYETI